MTRIATPPLPALWLMLLAMLGMAYASELDELGDEFLEYLGSLEGDDDNWTDMVAVNAARSASSASSSAASSASSKSMSVEAKTVSKPASKTAGKVEP